MGAWEDSQSIGTATCCANDGQRCHSARFSSGHFRTTAIVGCSRRARRALRAAAGLPRCLRSQGWPGAGSAADLRSLARATRRRRGAPPADGEHKPLTASDYTSVGDLQQLVSTSPRSDPERALLGSSKSLCKLGGRVAGPCPCGEPRARRRAAEGIGYSP